MSAKPRVRFAPSPTGLLHLGGLRTALYNFLYAKAHDGTFLLRIEDTDQVRFVPGSVENLISSLVSLGIDYDEGPDKSGQSAPYFQSQRLDLYHQHIKNLLASSHAYHCFCSKQDLEAMRNDQESRKETTKYDGRCRELTLDDISQRLAEGTPHVVRIKMPSDRIYTIHDHIRGDIAIVSDLVEDQVILKADGFPTYHLASVVDDHYMEITHVLRGEEWLYSTPKHIFIYESLGWTPPIWVHLPLLLNTDRKKLSKRDGDFSVAKYLSMGYLKEAVINFVALLGWHASDDREIYSLDELIDEFSLDRITKSGAIFDITKLDWLNGYYIRNLPLAYIADHCREYFVEKDIDISDDEKYLKVINRARDQISKLPDIITYASIFYQDVSPNAENLELIQLPESKKVISIFIEKLEIWKNKDFTPDDMTEILKNVSTELDVKGKNLYFPLRIALFGDKNGPDIPLLVSIYGIGDSINKLSKFL
jgi:glutamyl-tRNA synthetase